ncbi:MAG: hypothetical protein HC929_23210 [Leptolyngbyaceae cyanobacterium SM2_5_2]|nr:hypothetical protein [Leptolyngbyaceae cyanobacterium SM2_5_2]
MVNPTAIPPSELVAHRLQLHYAIQFIAATGLALSQTKPDGSQITLDWDPQLKGFVGQPIPHTAIQVALFPVALTSVILSQHQPVATLSLVGQTMTQALHWHKTELAKLGIAAESLTLLDYSPDDFPDHPLAHGATFEMGEAAGREAVIAYYASTQPLLAKIVAANPAASPIYIWPHHFDMATLMTYPSATDADIRYLGVGLSPGDQTYPEPYWYISPYPYPALDALPNLAVGIWHTEHWVGAVLTASQVNDNATPATFLPTAVATCKKLLALL